MKVKDIIIRAMRFIGREDLAVKLENSQPLYGDDAETENTLLYCVNAVEDELARNYFVLQHSELLYSVNGKYPYTSFTHIPVKILNVYRDGKAADYNVQYEYLECAENKITVEYRYVPQKKTLSGDSGFDGLTVSEKLIASGAASEYYLINGAMQESELWESKYREEIDRAQRKLGKKNDIPPRRWV